VIVYGFVAARVNVMAATVSHCVTGGEEMKTLVVFERPNVAVFEEPFGTVIGAQSAGVFQSSERGLRFHVALPAWLARMENIKINMLNNPAT